jgi:hypothetical protein
MTGLIIASEAQEQRALVQWLSMHPVLKSYYCKLNNEGKRSEAQGYQLKRLGMRAGASDLFIYYPTATYAGLWLEVKRKMHYPPSARRSATWIAQEAFMATVKAVGYEGKFCYGSEDGMEIIENYLRS